MPGAHFSHSFPIVNVGQIHRPVSGSQICPGCSQGKHSAREKMFIKICRSPIFERVFGLLVQPFGENPQNPGKHWSQVIPVMPGLQRHCPLTSSQSSSYAPIGSQAHSLLQPTPELMFQ